MTYTLNEIKGVHQGDIIIVQAENAIEAMKKCNMTCWIRSYEKFREMYFGKIYAVYKTENPDHVEYVCHK